MNIQFLTQVLEGEVCGLGIAVLELVQANQESFDVLEPFELVEQLLVGLSILDNEFGLAVDSEYQGFAGLLHESEELSSVALELGERADAVEVNQRGTLHQVHIK